MREFLSYAIASEKQEKLSESYLHERLLAWSGNPTVNETMKAEYDFSKMKGRKNPYASKLKRQVTIRMGEDVILYFKSMAENTGIPYQHLINLYLLDCVAKNRKVNISWLKQA